MAGRQETGSDLRPAQPSNASSEALHSPEHPTVLDTNTLPVCSREQRDRASIEIDGQNGRRFHEILDDRATSSNERFSRAETWIVRVGVILLLVIALLKLVLIEFRSLIGS
jgi:hypothetical protein